MLKCPRCKGRGRITWGIGYGTDEGSMIKTDKQCPRCRGTGDA